MKKLNKIIILNAIIFSGVQCMNLTREQIIQVAQYFKNQNEPKSTVDSAPDTPSGSGSTGISSGLGGAEVRFSLGSDKLTQDKNAVGALPEQQNATNEQDFAQQNATNEQDLRITTMGGREYTVKVTPNETTIREVSRQLEETLTYEN